MLENPLITIIIPVYRVEEYISECLESVRGQTYKNFECLIINDGSPDNSITIARDLTNNDSRFKVISQINQGLASARNCGIRNAKGDFIAFLDADDVWVAKKLEIQLDVFMNFPETDIVFPDVFVFGADLRPKLYNGKPFSRNPLELLAANLINGSGSSELIRKTSLERAGYYNESLRSLEDLEFWFRCAVRGLIFRHVPEPLVYVRVRSGSLSKNKVQMQLYNRKAFVLQLKQLRGQRTSRFQLLKYGLQRIQNSRKYSTADKPFSNLISILQNIMILVRYIP